MTGMSRLLVVSSADKMASAGYGLFDDHCKLPEPSRDARYDGLQFSLGQEQDQRGVYRVSPAEPSDVIPSQEAPRLYQFVLMLHLIYLHQ